MGQAQLSIALSIPKRSLKLSFRAWLVNSCLQILQEPSHLASIVERAGKANVPWSISICKLAEETAGNIEKARAMAQLGQRTPTGMAAEWIWLAYNHCAANE